MKSNTGDGDEKSRYYGRIEEIWELNYSRVKVLMFRVRWARRSTVTKEDQYFTTMVLPEAGSSAGANSRFLDFYQFYLHVCELWISKCPFIFVFEYYI